MSNDSLRETGGGAWGVRVTAASRLSFTLIDLNGEGGRRNGMASLSLADPAFRVVALPAADTEVVVDSACEIHRDDVLDFVNRLRDDCGWPPVRVLVERGVPAHTGFGSKTTTLLAIGRAMAALEGEPMPTEALARMARRGGTSGASVNLIDRGGYLVDGGHANPPDFNDDPQKYLLPSRFAGAARRPPVLINVPFPPWPILLIVTRGTKLHGKPELDWFRRTLPIPAEEARRTAHHVLMHLSPAVAESDYAAFCRALNTLTYEHHYKREQIVIQPEDVQQMFVDARRQPAIDAIGISVTGPMCFAFTRRPDEALAWCRELRERGVVEAYWFSTANNSACRIEAVTASSTPEVRLR